MREGVTLTGSCMVLSSSSMNVGVAHMEDLDFDENSDVEGAKKRSYKVCLFMLDVWLLVAVASQKQDLHQLYLRK